MLMAKLGSIKEMQVIETNLLSAYCTSTLLVTNLAVVSWKSLLEASNVIKVLKCDARLVLDVRTLKRS